MRRKRCHARGAIQPRGLVDILRQRRKARQQHHERKGRPLPGVDHDHRDHREQGIAEPVLAADAGIDGEVVDDAEFRRQHEGAPDHADDRGREHDRQDGDDAKPALAALHVHHQQRQRQSQRDLQHHGGAGVDETDQQRRPETVVGQQRAIVLQSDKAVGEWHREVHPERAGPDQEYQRKRRRCQQRQECRRQQCGREPALALRQHAAEIARGGPGRSACRRCGRLHQVSPASSVRHGAGRRRARP